jgi:uncharacterized protein with gpF-like domain
VPGALGDDMPEVEDEDDPDEDADRGEIGQHKRSSRAALSPQAEWARQIANEKRYVPVFLRTVRSIFRDQQRLVIARLEEQRTGPRALAIEPPTLNPELLIDKDEWRRLWTVRLDPVRSALWADVMRETLALWDSSEVFVFTDAMRKQLDEISARLIKQVDATTGKRLAEVISEAQAEQIAAELSGGVAEGLGTESIAKRIEGVFSVRRKDARTIARTEVHTSTMTAQLEALVVLDVDSKQWHTALDKNVRDSHAYAEGQVRMVGEPFDLGGEQASAPGVGFSGQLSAGNTINCRCFMTGVTD